MTQVNAVSSSGGAAIPAARSAAATKTEPKQSFEETLKKVSGHKYARVTEGDKKGMYVNQSGNARDGDAFRLVKRDGFEYHVYGTGKDRMVVRVPKGGDAAAGGATPAAS
jgi:hypothetical protein